MIFLQSDAQTDKSVRVRRHRDKKYYDLLVRRTGRRGGP